MRPRVLLNCAASRDGHLAGPDGRQTRLSDETDMVRVHRLRAGSDAILVGVGTVLSDDPRLTVDAERAEGEHPLRVVLDTALRTPPTAHVCDGRVPTRIYHSSHDTQLGQARLVHVPRGPGGVALEAVLEDLDALGVQTLMVEGGAHVLRSFLASDLWDEWTLYEAPVDLRSGPALPSRRELDAWGVVETSNVAQGEGWLRTFQKA